MSEPIRRAIEMHAEAKWQNADILLVSDGAFEVPKDIVAKVTRARATSGLRIMVSSSALARARPSNACAPRRTA